MRGSRSDPPFVPFRMEGQRDMGRRRSAISKGYMVTRIIRKISKRVARALR
jgi:hypothetical protein